MKLLISLFLFSVFSFNGFGQKIIKGVVSDEIGMLHNANIIIKNTNKGVVSNIDGYYEVEAKESDTLSVSYMGYYTKDILVGKQTEINTVLSRGVLLDEVEIIGYASARKGCWNCCLGVVKTLYYKNFKSDILSESLYPNPSRTGCFELKLLQEYKKVQIQISNLSGQTMRFSTYQNVNKALTLNLSNFSSGMYIINIIADGKHLASKKAIIGG